MGEFAWWIDHFEGNRGPPIESVRRFQLGESGDGAQLLRKADAAVDPDYTCAARLFVAEEQQHAALLLRLLGYLGGEPMRRHWSDAVFVRLRRLMGLRTELMMLTVPEVVALSYYGALARACPDPVTRAVAARIVADEHDHVRFQEHRLRAGFAGTGVVLRLVARGLWWVTAIGATLVIASDHGPLLDAIGYRRRRFVTDVLADFAQTVRAVFVRP
ncbi:ferritin-like domain-containing protein [Mycolicibacterium celeriflavum]|uniref:ferritin-like domain-containing protein n=1 Tax=Mycolicibacterium celeriflavum TaxID=1249101 RepID=UPI003CEE12C1